jgi:hypothetical protein
VRLIANRISVENGLRGRELRRVMLPVLNPVLLSCSILLTPVEFAPVQIHADTDPKDIF